MTKSYLDSALLFRSSLKVTFPDTLGNTVPQASALPFALLLRWCDSNLLFRSRDIVERSTS